MLMRTAMIIEQMGSAMCQSKRRMSRADMITPTLPKVSAKMCKNTPCARPVNENLRTKHVQPKRSVRKQNTQIENQHADLTFSNNNDRNDNDTNSDKNSCYEPLSGTPDVADTRRRVTNETPRKCHQKRTMESNKREMATN